MKEIKFRAWDKDTKRMRTVNTLYFVPELHLIAQDGDENKVALLGTEVELMQLTGMKDKTGRDIYEGDVLDTAIKKNGLVVWGELDWPGVGFWLKIGTDFYKADVMKSGKIIGNIHENPELLKVYV